MVLALILSSCSLFVCLFARQLLMINGSELLTQQHCECGTSLWIVERQLKKQVRGRSTFTLVFQWSAQKAHGWSEEEIAHILPETTSGQHGLKMIHLLSGHLLLLLLGGICFAQRTGLIVGWKNFWKRPNGRQHVSWVMTQIPKALNGMEKGDYSSMGNGRNISSGKLR